MSGGLAVDGVNGAVPPADAPQLPEILVALWRVALVGAFTAIAIQPRRLLEQLFKVAPSPLSASLTLLVKCRYFEELKRSSTFSDELLSDETLHDHYPWPTTMLDPLFPSKTAVRSEFLMDRVGRDVAEVRAGIQVRCGEGTIVALAEYLESCVQAEELPYEAVKTLNKIAFSLMPRAVHLDHQLRLSAAIRALFSSHRCSDLRSVVI
ncbi:hypothetical protein C8R46DRAFT_1234366 [Mycena filopes]|nr:hypothetical protein C8R46DRAFT_1234366 [Mycena filopes]